MQADPVAREFILLVGALESAQGGGAAAISPAPLREALQALDSHLFQLGESILVQGA